MPLSKDPHELYRQLKDFVYIHRVAEAFLLGVVLSAFLNPLVVPAVQDWEEQNGILSAPRPSVDVQYRDSGSTGYISEKSGVDLSDERYRTFFIEIQNPTKKLITELNIGLGFGGCAQTIGIHQTSLDSVFFTHSAEEIDTGFLQNNSCIATIDIEELPPTHIAEIFVVVDLEKPNKNFRESERLDPYEVAMYVNYEWEYNGRTYFEKGSGVHNITDKKDLGEVIR